MRATFRDWNDVVVLHGPRIIHMSVLQHRHPTQPTLASYSGRHLSSTNIKLPLPSQTSRTSDRFRRVATYALESGIEACT